MSESEPVEIKLTIDAEVDDAVGELCRGSARSGRLVYFVEDITPGIKPALPLFEAGLILRLRGNPGEKSDSTVKLRPCRRSQLSQAWAHAWKRGDVRFRIEQDWSTQNRSLAASCTAKSSSWTISDLVDDTGRLKEAFEEPQLACLAECTNLRLYFDGLTALGPIAATTWEETRIDGAVAERWTVGSQDFLELSIRCEDPAAAPEQQAAFERSVRELVEPASSGESKTRRVLTYLADHAAAVR
ncbi:MAG TPA: hypothetical protein VIT65_16735 [Microlunatus sp.]